MILYRLTSPINTFNTFLLSQQRLKRKSQFGGGERDSSASCRCVLHGCCQKRRNEFMIVKALEKSITELVSENC